MTEEAAVISAQQNSEARERLIRENIPFICRCASVTVNRYITVSDEEFSDAELAFNAAIDSFDSEKGAFSGYAALCIRSALISRWRKERRHSAERPMSSLARTDEGGRELPFDPEDPCAAYSDASLEILSLKLELTAIGIDFSDLPAASPKTKRTRALCRAAVGFVCGSELLYERFKSTGRLPFTELLARVPELNRKVLERHRLYIMAGILICGGDYTVMRSYFEEGERETR